MGTTIQIYGTLGSGPANLQEKTVTPDIAEQVINPDTGYDGMSQVTVNAVTASIDNNIVAGNIKNGVTILGVTGTYGSEVIPPEAGTLSSIVVGTLPKVSYTEGEALDLSSCVILANYSNGGQYDVTMSCVFTANDPVQYTDTSIGVSYTDNEVTKTLSIPITVSGAPVLAPASTICLYHLDNSFVDEKTGEAGGSGSYTSVTGHFGTAFLGSGNPMASLTNISISNINISTGTYTIEFWGKNSYNFNSTAQNYPPTVNCTNNSYALFTAGNIASSNAGLFLNNVFAIDSGTFIWKPSSWDRSKFHHFAAVFNQGTWYTFIDGHLSRTGALKSSIDSAYSITKLQIGDSYTTIDEVLVCAEAKYLTDFEPAHAPYYIEE